MVEGWREHQDAVASALDVKGFHAVAGAFKRIDFLHLVRETNRETMVDQGFAVAERGDMLQDGIDRCESAQIVLAKAGCTRWERMRRVQIPSRSADY